MRILGIIPARGGSKGVPRKNIKLLGDKPLIAYTIEAALQSQLTKVIVSTDDEEIAEVSRQYGAEVPFMRPADLASDTASSISMIQHALKTMESIEGICFDGIMLLQPTTPFRLSKDIEDAISIWKEKGSDSVISVVDVGGTHPARMKYLHDGYLIDPPFCEAREGQNRQELEPMFIRNGAIYLTKREVILKGSFKGKTCAAHIMSDERSVNIDTLFDFEYAEWLYSKQEK